MGHPLDITECSVELHKIITGLHQQVVTVSSIRTGSLSTEGLGVGGQGVEAGEAGSTGEKSTGDKAEQLGGQELHLPGLLSPFQLPLPSLCQFPYRHAFPPPCTHTAAARSMTCSVTCSVTWSGSVKKS